MKRTVVIGLILLAGTIGGVAVYKSQDIRSAPVEIGQQIETKTEKINLSIEDGESISTFEVDFREGMTALEATETAVSGNMEKKGEGNMSYITSLAGREARESEHEFWEFLVNGKQAEVGAGSYVVQKGDIIVWRLNSY